MITYPLNFSHLVLAHNAWKAHLHPTDFAIDATCGNGHDTLFLGQLLPQGIVFGFDLQQQALDQTHLLLKKNLPESQLARIILHCHCHSRIASFPLPQKPRLIVYNLGYLPGGDKTITTQTETTLQSLKESLTLLAEDGALSITCYPGHPEGAREEQEILKWAQKLQGVSSSHYRNFNRPTAPSFLWISPMTKKVPQTNSGSEEEKNSSKEEPIETFTPGTHREFCKS